MSGYHRDYLSQLIRKGDMRGVKIGRNWFTTEIEVKRYFASKKWISINKFFPVLYDLLASKIWVIIILVIIFIITLFLLFEASDPASYTVPGDFTEEENDEQVKKIFDIP